MNNNGKNVFGLVENLIQKNYKDKNSLFFVKGWLLQEIEDNAQKKYTSEQLLDIVNIFIGEE